MTRPDSHKGTNRTKRKRRVFLCRVCRCVRVSSKLAMCSFWLLGR